MFKKSIIAISVALTVSACGGSSDDNSGGVSTATGQFKDSNTAGIRYVSGGQSGITGADGSFTYEVGKTVTFSIGGVTIGTSNGKLVVTPVDLVSGGSSGSVEVQNIARFLIMLDDDGNPSNGINISSSVQAAAKNWTQVDFSAADISTELTAIISDAISADGGGHVLPDASAAQAHLESTLRCSYAGAYQGTFSGDDSGTFGVLVHAISGIVEGPAYSPGDKDHFYIGGKTPISYDQNVTFVSGVTTNATVFNGRFTSVNEVSGSWLNALSTDSGNYSGSRIGGATDAVYRFTGNYSGEDFGLFSFDVNASNNVTGVAYSVVDDELLTVSGTVSGATLAATVSDGTTIDGTLDTAKGLLKGEWNNSAKGLSGKFSGGGCKLN